MSVLRVGLVLVLAIAAAVAANIVLLGVASGPKDPVGRLSPKAGLVEIRVKAPALAQPSPVDTVTTPGDDGRSSGHGSDD